MRRFLGYAIACSICFGTGYLFAALDWKAADALCQQALLEKDELIEGALAERNHAYLQLDAATAHIQELNEQVLYLATLAYGPKAAPVRYPTFSRESRVYAGK